jgi:hypothetical protein
VFGHGLLHADGDADGGTALRAPHGRYSLYDLYDLYDLYLRASDTYAPPVLWLLAAVVCMASVPVLSPAGVGTGGVALHRAADVATARALQVCVCACALACDYHTHIRLTGAGAAVGHPLTKNW